MTINDPVVLAELSECHAIYEKALLANDAATLESLFWDSPHAIRYGVTENLYGASEITGFRRARPNINLDRTIRRLEILSLGDAAGIINLEFVRLMDGVERIGRQTQFWFRFVRGWKIASAHVSLIPGQPSYLDAAAEKAGIPIDGPARVAVSEDLKRLSEVAAFLTQFPLPESFEAAPVFHP